MATDSPTLRTVSHFALYRAEDRSLHQGWNAGFFSNNNQVLLALCDLVREGVPVDRIQYRYGFSAYRDRDQPLYDYDLYPDYFTSDPTVELPGGPIARRLDPHGYYQDLDYEWLNPVLRRYFGPSDRVRALMADWQSRYGVETERLIGVCYRGTDKQTEVRLAQPHRYLRLARQLLDQHPGCRVWIQTDQQQVRELFCRELGDRCWFLPEMPVTGGTRSLANVPAEERGVSSYDFGLRVLATAVLMSQCRVVIDHTGNMGLWIALFRGHWDRAYQFGATGHLVTEFRRTWGRRRSRLLEEVRSWTNLLT